MTPPEGRDTNASAIDAGDDPADWYVSEQDIDVTRIAEFWSSPSVSNPRLERIDNDYIGRIRKMVTACREGHSKGQGVYIAPAWMTAEITPEQQRTLSRKLGVPVVQF